MTLSPKLCFCPHQSSPAPVIQMQKERIDSGQNTFSKKKPASGCIHSPSAGSTAGDKVGPFLNFQGYQKQPRARKNSVRTKFCSWDWKKSPPQGEISVNTTSPKTRTPFPQECGLCLPTWPHRKLTFTSVLVWPFPKKNCDFFFKNWQKMPGVILSSPFVKTALGIRVF